MNPRMFYESECLSQLKQISDIPRKLSDLKASLPRNFPTPIEFHTEMAHNHMVRFLGKYSSNANVALFLALRKGYFDTSRILFDNNNINLNSTNHKGQSILEVLMSLIVHGHEEAMEFFIRVLNDKSVLVESHLVYKAVRYENIEIILALLHSEKVSSRDIIIGLVKIYTKRVPNSVFIESIIQDEYFDIELLESTCPDTGFGIAHIATLWGNVDLVKILLKYQVSFSSRDNNNSTPIDYTTGEFLKRLVSPETCQWCGYTIDPEELCC